MFTCSTFWRWSARPMNTASLSYFPNHGKHGGIKSPIACSCRTVGTGTQGICAPRAACTPLAFRSHLNDCILQSFESSTIWHGLLPLLPQRSPLSCGRSRVGPWLVQVPSPAKPAVWASWMLVGLRRRNVFTCKRSCLMYRFKMTETKQYRLQWQRDRGLSQSCFCTRQGWSSHPSLPLLLEQSPDERPASAGQESGLFYGQVEMPYTKKRSS